MLDPFDHAARVTGREQLGPFGCWTTSGVAASLSDVVGPHIYAFGAIPAPMIAVTLYGVRRHVLIEDGRVRRDGPVLPGRFRISQPDRDITVEAIPGIRPGKLLLLYLAPDLLSHIAMETDRPGPIELLDRVWDTEDTFLHIMARRLVDCLHKDRAVDRLVVKSLPNPTPISRAMATPLAVRDCPLNGLRLWSEGAVGKWPAGATVKSLA